jgi:hypothetical protein
MLSLPETKFLREDVNVWLVYSGNRRRFFEDFIENSAVFLDLPGFSANAHTFENEENLRRHVRMADAIREYHRGHTSTPPSRRVGSYSGLAASSKDPQGRSFNAEVGNAQRMYVEAKAGDVILSPPMGHYDPFLIGMISEEWNPDQIAYARAYGEDALPSRPVKWESLSVSRRQFPDDVAKPLQNPHAISLVDRSLYFEIFMSSFPSFVWGDTSKLDVYGNAYSSNDPLETYEAAFLIKFFAAAYCAFEAGRIDEFNQLPPQAGILEFYDPNRVLEFRQNFNSPGKFAIAAAAAAMGLSVAAGVAVVSDSSPAAVNIPKASAQLEKTIPDSNKNTKKIADGFLKSLSPQLVDKVNVEYAAQARAKLGVSLRRTEIAPEAK